MGQSAPTFVASDRTFTIDLSDAIFNQIEGQRLTGPLIDAGEEGAAVVRATITQTASSAPPTPVPDTGSTAALLSAWACWQWPWRGKGCRLRVKCPSIN
jgi:hypothetical protein